MASIWNDMYGMDILKADAGERCSIPEAFRVSEVIQAKRVHCQIEGYMETPLVHLKGLAASLGVKDILVKNEAKRFGLNAFKGLGGSFAMFCILCHKLGLDPKIAKLSDLKIESAQKEIQKMVFVTATDGNHGKGVSWAGGIFGCKVIVYLPAGSAKVRAQAIRMAGPAEVTITDMNYDQTVQYAMEQSKRNGWYLIQDTSWDDYEQIPTWIIQGYLTMAQEMTEELAKRDIKPTHLFLQAGVGAMSLILSKEELKEVRKHMGLNEDSIILLINTEGDTDPENYRDIVYNGAYPI